VCENRPEEAVVKIAPTMVAVDHDALESALPGRALKLGDRRRRIADRQRNEPEESRRMAPERVGESGVRFARQRFCFFDLELLDAGRRQRQRLDVDSGGVHCRHAAVADVGKLSEQRRQPTPDVSARSFSGRPGRSRKAGVAKCSSRAMVRIGPRTKEVLEGDEIIWCE